MNEGLDRIISNYRNAVWLMEQARRSSFPVGSVVYSLTTANHWGIVDQHGECPPDKLPVYFENGNTWFKDLDEWAVCKSKKNWPQWIKRFKRKRKKKEVKP